MKTCSKCLVEKEDAAFYVRPNGYHLRICKDCTWRRQYVWAKANGNSSVRNYHYMQKYGITLDEYNAHFTKQAGACAMCGRLWQKGTRRLSVDHEHATGQVRALLCTACNYDVSVVENKGAAIHGFLMVHNA